METLVVRFHEMVGDGIFIFASVILGLVLCFKCIPTATDWMVNSAAGLAGKYWGNDKRTLVINCSTNNPELLSMVVSFSLRRLGGIANPLGSNFANIYLMYIFAPIIAVGKWLFSGRIDLIRRFIRLLANEKKLVFFHISLAFLMFAFSSFAYWKLTGSLPLPGSHETASEAPDIETHVAAAGDLLFGAAVCAIGLLIFYVIESRLRRRRPELFHDIHDKHHRASWSRFFIGTTALVACCYVMNTVFLAMSLIYAGALAGYFGAAIFSGLHYFLGAAITSIPEAKVAIDNYERMTAPDLNTALGSASYSNMTNIAIATAGSVLAGLLMTTGVQFGE